MSIATFIAPLFGFLYTRLIILIANHLINIPLSLLLGLGKYLAFFIALIGDVVQLVLYDNILNNTPLGHRFRWIVESKLLKYRKPQFIEGLPRTRAYVGVMLLALLPLYFGGLFVAMFTAHLLKLEKRKSLIYISIGSLIGCFIWTIGVWSFFEFAIKIFRS